MQAIPAGHVAKPEAAQTLGVTQRSLDRYLRRFLAAGPEAGFARLVNKGVPTFGIRLIFRLRNQPPELKEPFRLFETAMATIRQLAWLLKFPRA